MTAITIEISHPEFAPGKILGFRYFWAFYVNGYDPARHCQPCFKGRRVDEFCTRTAVSGRLIVFDRMDRYPYLYVCGVSSGAKTERRTRNLHFPLKYVQSAVTQVSTYNGYILKAQNAVSLEIPPLPDGFGGKPLEHVRCKNFQFGVAHFGYSL